uniref:Uncharacterized protein n=1 Tax=Cannabis sativa TaxID=3483 RepID=A0A803PB45_CANSA
MKAIYYLNSSFLVVEESKKSSFIWMFILWGKKIFEVGGHWFISDGTKTTVYHDRWILSIDGNKSSAPHFLADDAIVHDILLHNGWWNALLINSSFSMHEVSAILAIL